MNTISAAIEAGGTKWRCAVGDAQGTIFDEITLPTRLPEQTLPAVVEALQMLQAQHGAIGRLGIGSFGPIAINPSAENYGCFINTPKAGWSGTNIIEPLRRAFGQTLPIYLDTDVNTAVYAESKIGLGKGMQNICYVTVGTGIGGGALVNGHLVKGRMHPEMGHMLLQASPLEPDANFSVCPFHTHCAEGRASGSAMKARWGDDTKLFPQRAWELEADYLAQLAVSLTAAYSPDLIIFGGGVVKYQPLLPMLRRAFSEKAGGYWCLPPLESYLQVTSLDDRAGLVGALMLAGADAYSAVV